MPMAAAGVITTRKVAAYGVISVLSAFAVVLSAFRQRSNFYSAAVMLGRSNGCMMVLFNFGLFLTMCFGKVCQKIFFGPLRAVEVEHLYERTWYAVTESLLAMTIFRDDFGTNFVILFATLLFLKVFHWLSGDRVEYMEQTPSVSRLFHFRMVAVLGTLFILDLFLVIFALEVILLDKNRMGIMIMFASEFMIISATLWSTIAKYIINVQDSRSEETWEGKSMYVFFVDLITDFLKLMTYVTFFALILSFYGLPLNIIRDVYVTARSFFGRLRDFIKYRAATKNMDTRFPDATRHDLTVMSDGTCIICREEMVARAGVNEEITGQEPQNQSEESRVRPDNGNRGLNETPKKLPCGHIFHFHCLRSWLERQQSCPTCRRTIFASPNTPAQTGPPNQQGADLGVNVAAATATTGNGATGTNASQTARDRLQSFLQQIQSDAQRVREQGSAQQASTSSVPNASGSSNLSAPAATTSTSTALNQQANSSTILPLSPTQTSTQARSRVPVQRALINSLFGGHLDRMNRRFGETSMPNSRGRPNGRSHRDDLVAGLVPPAPWTLKSSSKANSSDSIAEAVVPSESTVSSLLTEKAKAEESKKKEKEKEKREKKEKISKDPIDAREAARAAALKRFGISSTTTTKRPQPSTSSSSAPVDITKEVVERDEDIVDSDQKLFKVPGDPFLIPLFDPSTIANYESDFVPQLPFPLAMRDATSTSSLPPTSFGGTNLAMMDTLLQYTPEQLRLLSLQNRRGLQERLQFLTRVEGAIGNLVEEMTRALSVIPEGDDIDHNDLELASKSARDVKGKGATEGINSVYHNH